uniref:Uncharacterized protein n=1 Tax=Myoviridae sp. ctMb725 TaxID=2825088 RepID=A0A8S5PU37_9CAUD|nr:MAG TPA: Protein of unknown function (DUF4257) [Myoviridae sp. ctMb725]DAV34156.1 MAG TPA: Protein of unknown function (DUF4257) [Caudoviricetes sp.]
MENNGVLIKNKMYKNTIYIIFYASILEHF